MELEQTHDRTDGVPTIKLAASLKAPSLPLGDHSSITHKWQRVILVLEMSAPTANSTIFVGKKPVMNYVVACLTLLQNGTPEITLKARGKAISTAVDAAQILTKRFVPNVSVKSIGISTEQVQNAESGATSDVSSMEIHLSK